MFDLTLYSASFFAEDIVLILSQLCINITWPYDSIKVTNSDGLMSEFLDTDDTKKNMYIGSALRRFHHMIEIITIQCCDSDIWILPRIAAMSMELMKARFRFIRIWLKLSVLFTTTYKQLWRNLAFAVAPQFRFYLQSQSIPM